MRRGRWELILAVVISEHNVNHLNFSAYFTFAAATKVT